MSGLDAGKRRVVELVKRWRRRSKLGVDDLVGRMQLRGCDISRAVFENRFTTHLALKPNVPPDMTVALLEAVTLDLLTSERATAAEALEFAQLTQLPFDWLPRLAQLFPAAEFQIAYSQYQPQLDLRAIRSDGWPTAVTSFIGREVEIANLRRNLREIRLLTLVGVGGSGKTRLALQVAGSLRDEVDGRAYFVRLASLSNEMQLHQALAAAAHLYRDDERALLEQLIAFLTSQPALLILDNCEHIGALCARLASVLLEQCPQLRILATSREPLRAPQEVVWSVPSLTVPSEADLDLPADQLTAVVTRYDAVRLFIARAASALRTFRLTEANALAIARLCRRFDGIPLAIELAAANVKRQTLSEIEHSLRDQRFWKTPLADTWSSHHTMAAVMAWSYERLTQPQQAFLCRAAVFAGGFTPEAAQAVCLGHDVASPDSATRGDAAELALQLVERSLLEVDDGGSQRRFHMLEVVRQYAAARFSEANARVQVAIRTAHARHFLALAEQAKEDIQLTAGSTWVDRIDLERENLRAALSWAHEAAKGTPNEVSLELQLAAALWPYWQTAGYRLEGLGWLRGALAQSPVNADVGERDKRAEALRGASSLAFDLGDYDASRRYIEESLRLAREAGDLRGIGHGHVDLAAVATFGVNDYAAARAHLEESLSNFRTASDAHGVALALTRMGNLEHLLGNHARAVDLLEDSLRRLRQLNSTRLMATTLHNLGMVNCDRGDYAHAATYYEAARELLGQMRNPMSNTRVLLGLGRVYMCQGELLRAQQHFADAIESLRRLGDRWGLAQALNGLGDTARFLGEATRARVHFEEALSVLRDLGQQWMLAWIHSNLGYIYGDLGMFEHAWASHREALLLRAGSRDGSSRVDSIEGVADLAASLGAHTAAAQLFAAAKSLRQALSTPLSVPERIEQERVVQHLSRQMVTDDFDRIMRQGAQLSLDEAFRSAQSLLMSLDQVLKGGVSARAGADDAEARMPS